MAEPSVLVIDSEHYATLLDHAVKGTPEEVCGVLGGNQDDTRLRVTCVIQTTNAAESPRDRYVLDPADQLDAMRRIESADRRVLGFYHSHPTGMATPSSIDQERATWPDALYVIVAPADDPPISAWRWQQSVNHFEAVTVRKTPLD